MKSTKRPLIHCFAHCLFYVILIKIIASPSIISVRVLRNVFRLIKYNSFLPSVNGEILINRTSTFRFSLAHCHNVGCYTKMFPIFCGGGRITKSSVTKSNYPNTTKSAIFASTSSRIFFLS